jgi:nucleoid-associated protein YgaU
MARTVAILAVLCSTALSFAAFSCSSSKGRGVNVAGGEYYSQDEQAELSSSERNAYCADLTASLSAAQQDYEQKQKDIQDTKNLIQSIRQQIAPIEAEVLRLESSIRTVEDEIARVKALPREYPVRVGDSLSLIAMQKNIYNDVEKWWKIFEANRFQIEDPYYIYPDSVLVIPRDWPAESD